MATSSYDNTRMESERLPMSTRAFQYVGHWFLWLVLCIFVLGYIAKFFEALFGLDIENANLAVLMVVLVVTSEITSWVFAFGAAIVDLIGETVNAAA